MELGLRGRVCVITGASGGIGRAIAERLGVEGAPLLLVGRDLERLEATAIACKGAGADTVLTRSEDITRPAAAAEIVRAAQSGLGGIDVLVNNAGTSRARTLEQLTDHDWQAQWELHVMAPMRLMRAAAPIMAAGGYGRIVNVCSSAGRRPSGSLDMAYSVTKAAQLSLSRAFAEQYASQGVLINAVNPGPIAGAVWEGDGGLADQLAARSGGAQGRQDVIEANASRIPTGRYGTAEEVAAVVAFLCSEAAANVAGAAWSVDGGAVPAIF